MTPEQIEDLRRFANEGFPAVGKLIDAFEDLRAQLASARSAGVRGVVRYAYGEDNDGWYVELDGNQIEFGLTEDDARLRAEALNTLARIEPAPLQDGEVVVPRAKLEMLLRRFMDLSSEMALVREVCGMVDRHAQDAYAAQPAKGEGARDA